MAGENIPGKRKLYRSENPAIENAIKGLQKTEELSKQVDDAFKNYFEQDQGTIGKFMNSAKEGAYSLLELAPLGAGKYVRERHEEARPDPMKYMELSVRGAINEINKEIMADQEIAASTQK